MLKVCTSTVESTLYCADSPGVDAASLPHPATAVATIATAAALPAATTLAVALAVLTRAASARRL